MPEHLPEPPALPLAVPPAEPVLADQLVVQLQLKNYRVSVWLLENYHPSPTN